MGAGPETAKAAFLARYNPGHCVDEAVQDALLSALQRNRTYGASATALGVRSGIRATWAGLLGEQAQKYRERVSMDAFKSDVLDLRRNMNQRFDGYFCDEGFRIAHAQKSLSVYLKHLWCIGVIPEPPACPVDRIILSRAGAPYSLRTWTRVDSLDVYERQVACLVQRAEAQDLSLAVWELISFQGS